MEITNEVKAKVFAPYVGCECAFWFNESRRGNDILTFLVLKEIGLGQAKYKAAPILLPLWKMTDEDAAGFIKSFEPTATVISVSDGKVHWTDECPLFGEQKQLMYLVDISNNCYPLSAYQYLQSKGYDLPHYLLGGKTLKESGLAIYEQEKSK